MKIFTFISCLALTFNLFATEPVIISKSLNWSDTPIVDISDELHPLTRWSFEEAAFTSTHPSLPLVSERFKIEGNGLLDVEIVSMQFENFDKDVSEDDTFLKEDLKINTFVEQERKAYFGTVFFIPIIKQGNTYKRLISFELKINFRALPSSNIEFRTPPTFNSVLETGDIYKIAVSEAGIHKLDYNFFKDNLPEIDIDNVDPRTIKLYGNGGGMLPERIATERYDDLEENAIEIVGEADGQFDSGDYLLFYAEGAGVLEYDQSQGQFTRHMNIYDNNNYYFIKIGSGQGKRIETRASVGNSTYTTDSYDAYQRFEEDKTNLLHRYEQAQGSGKLWVGDIFDAVKNKTYDNFSFPNIITTENANLKVGLYARNEDESNFQISISGEQLNVNIPKTTVTNVKANYAELKTSSISFLPNASNLPVSLTLTTPAAIGWVDYLEINARSSLQLSGEQLSFRDKRTLTHPAATFQVSGMNNNTVVWNVSNSEIPVWQQGNLTGSQLSFAANIAGEIQEFVAFDKNGTLYQPTVVGKVDNQNIHNLNNVDLVILYHEDFAAEAERLATHRRDHNDYSVATVEINKLYNEFSSGRVDVSAVRDFARMLMERSDQFKYLLLFGDASFDYRNIINLSKSVNFIPVYETEESLDPIDAFPTDDYFALLSDSEGDDLKGALDIAVGRFPVQTPAQATAVVNKIINYDTNSETLGDWRNRLTFAADDEDSSLHLRQTDRIKVRTDTVYDIFNVRPIYFDAFQQIATFGEDRYPKANEALNNDMFKGMLVLNYLGHGGAKGWAQERVLQLNDIKNWTNYNSLPLFVTATCQFTGFDDTDLTSAGEEAFLNSRGGVIGLFTTVRAVYANHNERLVKAIYYDNIFERVDGEYLPLGEVMRMGKNANSQDTLKENARKFLLIGDPSMHLALPEHLVSTTSINGQNLAVGLPDTVHAMQKVTIEGNITDNNGNILTNFNGRIFPTVFDKKIIVSTLGQDNSSIPEEFTIQNVLFRGAATVTNGAFTFSFVIPKDINYEYGFGKISYYAENGETDAAGYYDKLVIGGTSTDMIADDLGPKVEVFMDTENFVFGDVTSDSPTLLAKITDDNGINVSASSIGHGLTGNLDEDQQNTLLLNDFYEAELDDYTKGTVRYPLKDLAEGRHQVRVKAWDVANNSGEGMTEFIVSSSAKIALDHVLNYPNPFTTQTEFQFEHNRIGQTLDVQVQIYTISGKLIKNIQEQVVADNYRIGGIYWDGKDDYGDDLGRGVYLYKIKVRSLGTTASPTTNSDFERLVILK